MLLFDGELHGSIHSCSFSRRNAVLKQTTRRSWHPPLSPTRIKSCRSTSPNIANRSQLRTAVVRVTTTQRRQERSPHPIHSPTHESEPVHITTSPLVYRILIRFRSSHVHRAGIPQRPLLSTGYLSDAAPLTCTGQDPQVKGQVALRAFTRHGRTAVASTGAASPRVVAHLL